MDDFAISNHCSERRIVEHGPSCGTHYEKDIPSYIVLASGKRANFVRLAEEDENGLVALSQLGPDEMALAPGLIYREQR